MGKEKEPMWMVQPDWVGINVWVSYLSDSSWMLECKGIYVYLWWWLYNEVLVWFWGL